jgi:hypothetical protein
MSELNLSVRISANAAEAIREFVDMRRWLETSLAVVATAKIRNAGGVM